MSAAEPRKLDLYVEKSWEQGKVSGENLLNVKSHSRKGNGGLSQMENSE